MAFLESCCCCSLAISSAVVGVYLLVAYAIAFTTELWWILESPVALPVPAYLLCLSFFILFVFSALLLHGLSVKRTTCLLVWMFMMGILLGPEAGLVLYISIHYWRITSLYGLIEVTCWACRLLVNISGIICVQSLYSIWREEKSILMRLEALKMSPMPQLHEPRGRRLSVGYQSHKNLGYVDTESKAELISETKDLSTLNNVPYDEMSDAFKADEYDPRFFDPYFADGGCGGVGGVGFSEFSASNFDASVAANELRCMPYSTQLRGKANDLERIAEEADEEEEEEEEESRSSAAGKQEAVPKTRSLIDFTEIDCNNAESGRRNPKTRRSISLNFINSLGSKETRNWDADRGTGSLDRKIIKNKNLKILSRLSPFLARKARVEEVNVYRVNPPEADDATTFANLDTQLNRIYSNRGMYTFDESTRKVIFYPPEYFNKAKMTKLYYTRMDSYGSSHSRSSADNDSEDIRRIGDIAL